MGNPVVHFEVVGRDAEALQGFYRDAFDWQMQPSGPGYAMAHPGEEGGINGGIGAAMEGGAGHVAFYVAVPDLEAALSKIEGLGGSTVMGSTEVPEGPTIAMFADPEGHVVGLLKADS
ncbi:MAG: VOC family protein, partial [Actinomycetota bacterium]|nr:VOC family protein [Actinomycetota bacterium]